MLGIGGIIGTGIFVLTAEAAQKAGPGMMLSFIIAGVVCAVAALCYAELASMVPVAGSAYTYSYAVLGGILRLAGRLGPDPGICGGCLGRRRRLVGLCGRPAGALARALLPSSSRPSWPTARSPAASSTCPPC
ncbi:amino acid permease [Caulobacter segnis]